MFNKIKSVLFRGIETIRLKFSGLGFRKIKFIDRVYTFFFKKLRPDHILLNGQKFYIDPSDVLNISRPKNREGSLLPILTKEIKHDYNVLDLGAHIGFYTVFMANLVGSRGKVYAFEPSPENFTLLRKNSKEVKHQNVTIENKGVADKTKKEKFYLYGSLTNSLGVGLYDDINNASAVEVDIVSLDDYFQSYDGSIDFIKMDIEGAEKLALDGMINVITKNPQLKILTEFAPFALSKVSRINPEEYLFKLKEWGFTLFELEGYTTNLLPIDIKKLTLTLSPSDGGGVATNIFCVRQ